MHENDLPEADTPDGPETPLPVPTVSAVGILSYPAWDEAAGEPMEADSGAGDHEDEPMPARKPFFRAAVLALLLFFAVATIGTSILTVGAYCLTSHGADTRAINKSLYGLYP